MELDPAEIRVWNAIDGNATTDGLQRRFAQAEKHLRRFHGHGLIELVPAQWPEGRKPVLVIEPHMDDAVLSIGGTMWQERMRSEFTVVSVAGRSNFTSYHKIGRDFFNIDRVTALRRAESELAMRLLGGAHRVLDGLDAPLRYQPGNWTVPWFEANRRGIAAFINHSAADREIADCSAMIRRLLERTDADEVWMPMGVGTSADHEMTRNACLRALRELARGGRHFKMVFYQDVPYAERFPRHARRIRRVLDRAGATGTVRDVTGVMPAKLRLVSIFASQFKMGYMAPKVEAAARAVEGARGRSCEFFASLGRLPERIDASGLHSGREHVLALRRKLARWHPRNRGAGCVTLLCPMGAGCWKNDMEFLLRAFPRAVFEAHLSADACDEARRLVSPRIRIRPVRETAAGWIPLLLLMWLRRQRPLILLTGIRHSGAIPLLAMVFCHCRPLVATTINHLVLALEAADGVRGASCAPEVQPLARFRPVIPPAAASPACRMIRTHP